MDIRANIDRLEQRLEAACHQSGRKRSDLHLIAVTKTQDATVLPILAELGITDFGENRLDHLEGMQRGADLSWNFHGIGRVQSRQLPQWAERCSSLHSLHEEQHVERLAQACAKLNKRLPVFIQINTSNEASKAGLNPDALESMLAACAKHPNELDVLGLMCMAPLREADCSNDRLIGRCFADLRKLAETFKLKRLSMGMSGDFELALAEGATDIRLGSTLFE